jgi:hypothetical protein
MARRRYNRTAFTGAGLHLTQPAEGRSLPPKPTKYEPSQPRVTIDDVLELQRQQRLTERDFAVLDWTATTGYALSTQVARLHYQGHETRTTKRMKRLFDYGILGRLPFPNSALQYGLPRRVVYVPGAVGVVWLQNAGRDAVTYDQAGANPLMVHNLLLAEALVEAVCLARRGGYQVWVHNVREAGVTFKYQDQHAYLAPDGLLVLQKEDGATAYFYIELDTGSESPTYFAKKRVGYAAYRASNQWRMEGLETFPSILVVAATSGNDDDHRRRLSESRRDRLAQEMVRHHGNIRWMFATLQDVRENVVFRVQGGEEPVRTPLLVDVQQGEQSVA